MIGIPLDDDMSDRVWSAIVSAQTNLASINWKSGLIKSTNIEINHGDVVGHTIRRQIKIMFVACSLQRFEGPISCWPYKMSLSSARDEQNKDGKRIYWDKPLKAIEAVYTGLLQRKPDHDKSVNELAVLILKSAAELSVNAVKSYMSEFPIEVEEEKIIQQTKSDIKLFLSRRFKCIS
jgi:hypothetical protein